MASFPGFPANSKYTGVPTLFFTQLLPRIQDPAELRVTLYLFWALGQKKPHPKFVSLRELLGSPTLITALAQGSRDPKQELQKGLESATARGTVLALPVSTGVQQETLYFFNTEANQQAIQRISSGELDIGAMPKLEEAKPLEHRNIFMLYEESIGPISSPVLAEELIEAASLYPQAWLEEAFREAVDLNKRSWRYISRILERWQKEGKDGEPRRHPQEDADKYVKGKYGHLFQG